MQECCTWFFPWPIEDYLAYPYSCYFFFLPVSEAPEELRGASSLPDSVVLVRVYLQVPILGTRDRSAQMRTEYEVSKLA